MLVLGDRLEIFAAAAAASASRKIIAHIHGGDVAAGINDDVYRHGVNIGPRTSGCERGNKVMDID